METPFLGHYGAGGLLRLGGMALAAIILIVVLVKLFAGGRGKAHLQRVQCSGCGWQGEVSRYAGRCPRCNNPLGEQRAKRQGGSA